MPRNTFSEPKPNSASYTQKHWGKGQQGNQELVGLIK